MPFILNEDSKYITTPLYLYNDHECRSVVLQQLIRLGETYNSRNFEAETIDDSSFRNQAHSENEGSKYIVHPPTSYLSFNMYKFNYEIGKKEYVIDGKSERRLRQIKENHCQGEPETQKSQDTEVNIKYVQRYPYCFLTNIYIYMYIQYSKNRFNILYIFSQGFVESHW